MKALSAFGDRLLKNQIKSQESKRNKGAKFDEGYLNLLKDELSKRQVKEK